MTAEVIGVQAPLGQSVVDDLESGVLRAAWPDPDAPGGWRVDPEVKRAILDLFRDRTTSDWSAGPLTFRDRSALAPRDVRGGPGESSRVAPPFGAVPTSATTSSSCHLPT
jgi:hypothetical protein